MGTNYYRVVDGNAVVLGWVSYQNTADVWHNETWSSLEDARAYANGWTCDRTCGRTSVRAVTLQFGGDAKDTCSGRWCATCSAFVLPPFDGYNHHEYDCHCGKCDGVDDVYRRGLEQMSEKLSAQYRDALEQGHQRERALLKENDRLRREVQEWRDEVAGLKRERR